MKNSFIKLTLEGKEKKEIIIGTGFISSVTPLYVNNGGRMVYCITMYDKDMFRVCMDEKEMFRLLGMIDEDKESPVRMAEEWCRKHQVKEPYAADMFNAYMAGYNKE